MEITTARQAESIIPGWHSNLVNQRGYNYKSINGRLPSTLADPTIKIYSYVLRACIELLFIYHTVLSGVEFNPF